jgi:hypothetical protein
MPGNRNLTPTLVVLPFPEPSELLPSFSVLHVDAKTPVPTNPFSFSLPQEETINSSVCFAYTNAS